jgi:prepilin-type N-terminal cleavage/methylation domain-containing protein/prepilin-type processing-associated H-X9-DG protein
MPELSSRPRVRLRGFTLIELLFVIAIIAVLIALLLPAVQQAREAARRSQCKNNLKQMGLALHNYHEAFQTFPPGYIAGPDTTKTTPGWGWPVLLLPQLDQAPLYNQLNLNVPIQDPTNTTAIKTLLPVFLCPSDIIAEGPFNITDSTAPTPVVVISTTPSSYAGSVGNDSSDVDDNINPGGGVLFRNSNVRFADITDGTSNTIVIGERSWSQTNGIWVGAPDGGRIRAGQKNPFVPLDEAASFGILGHAHWINILTDPDGGMDDFSSLHSGGAQFLFADGSVRFLQSVASPGGLEDEFQAFGSRAGNEVPGGFGY